MRTVLLTALLLSLNSCFFFSSFQSAKMLDKQELEISGSAAVLPIVESSTDDERIFIYGAQFSYGVTKRFNLRSRASIMAEYRDTVQFGKANLYSHLSVEPKIGLGPHERFAFTAPVGVSFGIEEQPVLSLAPTFIFSAHAAEEITLNASISSEFFFTPDPWFLPAQAVTLGATFMPKDAPMTVTPEIGVQAFDGFMAYAGFSIGYIHRKTADTKRE